MPENLNLMTLVAAYARVSIEGEMNQHSLSAQVDYYTKLIQSNPKWENAGIYADYGLTGTKADRPGFQSLIKLCDDGKANLVLTKSISRFCRNTVAKRKPNNGEVQKYFVHDDHEAIISQEEYDITQIELEERKGTLRQHSAKSIFSGKIICGDCGQAFGSKVWHSTDKYRRVIWQCNAKFHNEKKCTTPHLSEDEIKAAFLKAINMYIVAERLIETSKVEEQAITSIKAILDISRTDGTFALEQACKKALEQFRTPRYVQIIEFVKKAKLAKPIKATLIKNNIHGIVRGSDYYKKESNK